MSSRCAASSSSVCVARLLMPVSRAWRTTSVFQSLWVMAESPQRAFSLALPGTRASGLRVLHAGDVAQRRDELRPVGALCREHAAAGLSNAVVAATALARFLDPPGADAAP